MSIRTRLDAQLPLANYSEQASSTTDFQAVAADAGYYYVIYQITFVNASASGATQIILRNGTSAAFPAVARVQVIGGTEGVTIDFSKNPLIVSALYADYVSATGHTLVTTVHARKVRSGV